MKKSLIYTIGVVSALVIGFGSWFAYNEFVSVESYPTLDGAGASFQGKSVETQFGYLEFSDDDVDTYQADADSKFISSPKGIQFYSLYESATVEEVMNNIQPKEGLKVLFAFYSPGEEELGLEKGFHTYPVGPFISNEIEDPVAFEVPEGRGFIILSNEDYQFNSNVIKDSTRSAKSFKVKLKDNESGWVLYPLSGPGNLNHPRIEIAFIMNDDGEFEEVTDFRDVEIGKNSFAWIKLREKQPGDEEEAVEAEEEIHEAAEEEAIEEDEGLADVSDLDDDLEPAAEPTAVENMTFQMRPLTAVHITQTAVTDEADTAVSTDDAYIKSVKYLNNIETSSALVNTPSAQFPEIYEGDFIDVSSLDDDKSTAYIMSAVEIEVGGTQGSVDINSIEYSTFSQRQNKIGLDWKSWKDDQTDGVCMGKTPAMNILQYNNGVFSDMALFVDENDNKIFSASSEASQAYLTKLEAGKKYVLVLSMQGMDSCAKKFNWEAPLDVKARVRTDFVNMEFIVPNESAPVNWSGAQADTSDSRSRIEGSNETRWVNFIDKTPYS